MLRQVILGLLRHDGPGHGYALMKRHVRRSATRVSTGHFYRELQLLADEGLIRSRPNPPDADPRRLPFEITPAGTTAFDAWLLGRARAAETQGDEFTERAYFVSEAKPLVAKKVLERWEDELRARQRVLERFREDVGPVTNGNGGQAALGLPFVAWRLRRLAVDLELVEELEVAIGATSSNGAACDTGITDGPAARRAGHGPRDALPGRTRSRRAAGRGTDRGGRR